MECAPRSAEPSAGSDPPTPPGWTELEFSSPVSTTAGNTPGAMDGALSADAEEPLPPAATPADEALEDVPIVEAASSAGEVSAASNATTGARPSTPKRPTASPLEPTPPTASSQASRATLSPRPAVIGRASEAPRGTASPHPAVIGRASVQMAVEVVQATEEAVREQIDVFMAESPPFVQSYIATLQPWGRFAEFELPEDGQEVQRRIERNLINFQANYLLILVVFLVIALFSHPVRLAATSVVVGSWALCLRKGVLDPARTPRFRIGGVELAPAHWLMLLSAASTAFLFLVAGDVVLMLVGFWAICAAAHSALHPGIQRAPVYAAVPTGAGFGNSESEANGV